MDLEEPYAEEQRGGEHDDFEDAFGANRDLEEDDEDEEQVQVGDDPNNSRVRGRDGDGNDVQVPVVAPPAPQRPRVDEGFEMPSSYGNHGTSLGAIRRTTIVNLNVLTDPDAEPSMTRAIVLQILRIIAHNPHVQNGSNAQTCSRP